VVQGMEMFRNLGRFIEFSILAQATQLDWSFICDHKELDLLGAHLSPHCFPAVIDWIHQGKIATAGVVENLLSLEEWEKAFDIVGSRGGSCLKVVIQLNYILERDNVTKIN
jgi:erythritol/L-threitol dehydrogenase